MTVTLAQLTERSGQDVLDHVERETAVPVISGPQAQGDLLVIPYDLVADDVNLSSLGWESVPPEGVELLRSATGGNPHTLVADPGTCRWARDSAPGGAGVQDRTRLALGALRTTAPAYLIHAEHGGTGIAPGTYVVRRQREGAGIVGVRSTRTRGGVRALLVADGSDRTGRAVPGGPGAWPTRRSSARGGDVQGGGYRAHLGHPGPFDLAGGREVPGPGEQGSQ